MPPSEPHLLSTIDHLFLGHAFSILLHFEGRLDEARLEASLATVLKGIPPLASSLVGLGNAHYGLVPLSPVPAWIDVHEVPQLPSELSAPSALGELVPRITSTPGQPLLAVRLTCAPSDCILAVSVSHAIADGYSLFLFLRAWSRAMSERRVEPLPWARQWLASQERRASATVTPEEFWNRTGFTWSPPGRALDVPRPSSFGKRTVPPDPSLLAGAEGLSSNDLLCAWLIQSHAGLLAGEAGLAVTIPVDYRRSLQGLPGNYFGNAIRGAPLWLDRRILRQETLPELAMRVKEAIRGVLHEHGARDSLECLGQVLHEQGHPVLSELHTVHPSSGFLVTNVSRLPFGMVDLGRGPPLRVLLPAVEERTAVIQQTGEGFELSVNVPA